MKSKKKQRLLALILSMVLMLSASISAMAEGEVPAEASGTETTETQAAAQSLGEEAVPETEVAEIDAQTSEISEESVQEATEQETSVPSEETADPVQEAADETAETEMPTTEEITEEEILNAEEQPAETTTTETTAEEQPAETPEEILPEEVISEAAELKQEFTDENGNVTQTVTAYVPEGAFQATADQISMEVSLLDTDDTNYIKGMMEELLPENYYLDGYVLYQVDFKVNGEITQPAKAVTISMTGNDLAVEDVQKAHVFYYDPEDPEVEDDEDQLAEVIQKDQLIKSLEESGESTENIEDYDYSEIAVNEENADTITVKGWESTIYGCYVEKEAVTELTYVDDSVTVTVSADQPGILPQKGALQVTPIEKDKKRTKKQYQEVEKQLQEKAEEEHYSISGFLAYDITILNEEREEVEPEGMVRVSMEYKEAALPEDTSEEEVKNTQVSMLHMEEDQEGNVQQIVDMTEAGQTEILQTTQEQKVEKIQIQTESFSTFVITWGNEYCVTVHYIDENGDDINEDEDGNQINPENATEALNGEVILAEYARAISGYTYQTARINNKAGTEIAEVRVQSQGTEITYQYKSYKGNWTEWTPDGDSSEYHIYLVYQKSSLHEIDTITSSDKGIHMRMIDYPDQQFGGATWSSSTEGREVKPGILSARVDEETGYPDFSDEGAKKYKTPDSDENLGKYFLEAVDADRLFSKDVYEKDGYFYFNSEESSASFNQSTGNFNVYEELMTARISDDGDAVESNFWYHRGNFLPYNTINNMTKSGLISKFDAYGNRLDQNDPGYGKTLYLPDGYEEEGKDVINYHFGMELSAQFVQMPDGKNGENPMRYEFTGDDDLWVYIDGILVLDMGGCHDARSGYIDFSTGEVAVQQGVSGWTYTTIKEMFNKAGIETEESDWKEVTYTSSETGEETIGCIFQDYSRHKFQMWYMERGTGASNLKVKFNLPVIPEGQIEISKELGPESNIKYGDVSFGFELYVEDESQESEGKIVYKKVTSTDLDTYKTSKILNNGQSEDLHINNEGRFYLKPGEKAIFHIPENLHYYVKEVDLRSEGYEEVKVNGTTVTEIYDDDTEKTSYSVESGKETVANRPQIVFTNICTKENLGDLTIKKLMAEDQTSEDTFTMLVEMENTDGDLAPYNGEYKLYNANGVQIDTDGDPISEAEGATGVLKTTDGKISLKAGWYAVIENILADTAFQVTETDPGFEYEAPEYQLETTKQEDTHEPSDPDASTEAKMEGKTSENGINGEITRGYDSMVTVTNRYTRKIQVEKIWAPNAPQSIEDPEDSTPLAVYVGLYEKGMNDVLQPTEKTLELKADQWSGIFDSLDYSKNYEVRELRPAAQGEEPEFTIDERGYIGITENDTMVEINDRYYWVSQVSDQEINGSTSVTITNTQAWQMKKISSSRGENNQIIPAAGAEFTAVPSGGEGTTYYGKSGNDGTITWYTDAEMQEDTKISKTFDDGTYTLTETKAPGGYALQSQPGTMVVENGWIKSLEWPGSNPGDQAGQSEEGIWTVYLENTPLYELPSAGGPGIFLYMIGGTLLLMAGSLMIYINRRRGVLRR